MGKLLALLAVLCLGQVIGAEREYDFEDSQLGGSRNTMFLPKQNQASSTATGAPGPTTAAAMASSMCPTSMQVYAPT